VIRAIADEARQVHLYPDGDASRLRAALATRLAVAPEQIIFGNGADELLALLAWAPSNPATRSSSPSVVRALRDRRRHRGRRPLAEPLAGYDTDLDDMLRRVSERTKAVILCSPTTRRGRSYAGGRSARSCGRSAPSRR